MLHGQKPLCLESSEMYGGRGTEDDAQQVLELRHSHGWIKCNSTHWLCEIVTVVSYNLDINALYFDSDVILRQSFCTYTRTGIGSLPGISYHSTEYIPIPHGEGP